ncbi:MAG: hypothetical protein R3C17_04935 [Planctomycetaceae bacterium]
MLCLLFSASMGCKQQSGNSAEAESIAKIISLGGSVEHEGKDPFRPVVRIYLHRTSVSDTDLAVIRNFPKIQNLFLGHTKISDVGLTHLEKATTLITLSLNGTAITDQGLIHLSGLKLLKTLNVQETQVTQEGIAALRSSLKDTVIAR